VEKVKGKRLDSRVEAGPDIAADSEEAPEPAAAGQLIIRRKKFLLEPMTDAEAIEQMHMLGHEEFFLFQNLKTAAVNVIYKRRDGTYGILEPDIR